MLDEHPSIRMKATVCVAMWLMCLIVIAPSTYIAYMDYTFSYPPKLGNLSRFPGLSAAYYKLYYLSWLLVFNVFILGMIVLVRKTTTTHELVEFSLAVITALIAVTAVTVTSLYLANQTFVFRFQNI